MFDIGFYMKAHELERQLTARGRRMGKQKLFDLLESFRNRTPVVYNVETTNACNMRCQMCPRTTMMTRKVKTMDRNTFLKVVDQIQPHPDELWETWKEFAFREYGIPEDTMGENHFFLYIIPRVLQLHGYGDPLLDKRISEYVKILTERNIPSYFSCNPANIDVEKMTELFANGLSYIKYSIETVNDDLHKEIRGQASNFTQSYEQILKLLDVKASNKFGTTIVITMLDLNRANQKEEFEQLKKMFHGLDVYIYLKSEDQQWYRQDYHGTGSIHWSEFCKHPWMSVTVKSDGEVAMCMEDFNNEIILGDVKKESLADIWNGKKYEKFRWDHVNLAQDMKCTLRCDMKLAGGFVEVGS
jgi:radical SAM protein with 4Fe4S-binding SPASM domain